MRLDEELLNKMQAAFWKREAMFNRVGVLQLQVQAAGQEAEKADGELQALLSVANNRHNVTLGQTHVWDPATGEIKELPPQQLPTLPTPPAPRVN